MRTRGSVRVRQDGRVVGSSNIAGGRAPWRASACLAGESSTGLDNVPQLEAPPGGRRNAPLTASSKMFSLCPATSSPTAQARAVPVGHAHELSPPDVAMAIAPRHGAPYTLAMMKHISDADLEALLNDLESDCVERKESFSGGSVREKARQAVCAFANDFPNHNKTGILFIGAKDDGTPSGLPITDDLLLQLADMRSDGKILPMPVLNVEKMPPQRSRDGSGDSASFRYASCQI